MNAAGEGARTPLADLLRPRTLDEVFGQRHLLGPGKPLRAAIASRRPHSMILWGPPGVGKTTLARQARRFDKGGEQFYDQISALHKSVRGSHPDAALYCLGRMLDGGADPRYLLRRMRSMAWEDIGLADPRAIRMVNAAADAWNNWARRTAIWRWRRPWSTWRWRPRAMPAASPTARQCSSCVAAGVCLKACRTPAGTNRCRAGWRRGLRQS